MRLFPNALSPVRLRIRSLLALSFLAIAQLGPMASTLFADSLVPKQIEAIDKIFANYDGMDRPGASIAVVQDGSVTFAKGYGAANLEYQVPNTAQTIFHVASVSKQFTCFAILLLAEEGKLSLDDEVREYLDWVPEFEHKVTIRHLIHHTSGIRDQWSLLMMSGVRMDDVITMNHLRRILSRQQELNFEPGKAQAYSNSGYFLLAEIVAKVSGMSFRTFCQQRIFEPLEMKHTHFHDDQGEIVPGRAYSYFATGEQYKKAILSFGNVGATSLFCTVEDMARWMDNLDTGKVGGEKVRDQMRERGVLASGRNINYGFGLVHSKHKGLSLIGHSGGDAGFRSHVLRSTDDRVAVIVFGNRNDLNTAKLAVDVLDVVLKKEDASEASAGNPPVNRFVEMRQKKISDAIENQISLSNEQENKYVGVYKMEDGKFVETRIRNGELMIVLNARWSTLIPVDEGAFVDKTTGWNVTINSNEKEAVRLVVERSSNRTITGERVAFETYRQLLEAYPGRFHSPELDATYTIEIRDSQLRMSHPREWDFELIRRNKNQFRGEFSMFERVVFERDESGAVTGFRASNSRIRNLLFVKQDSD